MKNPLFNSAILAGLISIIGKMGYHILFLGVEDFDLYTRFFFIFCLLTALFFGLRMWKRQNGYEPFTEDVKNGMKIVSVYAMILSAFTWLYYEVINPAYFQAKIQEVVDATAEADNGADLENVANTAEFIFNAFTHSTITLFATIVLGFFYTLVVAMIFRYKPEAFGIK